MSRYPANSNHHLSHSIMKSPKKIALLFLSDARPSKAEEVATENLRAQGYTVRHRNIQFLGEGEKPEACELLVMTEDAIKLAPVGMEEAYKKTGCSFQSVSGLQGAPTGDSADKLTKQQLLDELAKFPDVTVPAGLEVSELRDLLVRTRQALL